MDGVIREDLVRAQKEIYDKLMDEFNDSYKGKFSPNPNTRVTLVISTLRSYQQPQVRTMIHILKGIVLPRGENGTVFQKFPPESPSYGFITSLRWLNGSFLENRLMSKWNAESSSIPHTQPNSTGCVSSFRPFGLMTISCISHAVNISLPTQLDGNAKLTLTVQDEHEVVSLTASPEALGVFELSIKNSDEERAWKTTFKSASVYEVKNNSFNPFKIYSGNPMHHYDSAPVLVQLDLRYL